MAGKIKRSKVAIFLNTGSNGVTEWSLIGDGVTEQTINYNPQTADETYVHQDSGTTNVESYKPTIPTPMTAIKGDAIFDYIDHIRRSRKVLDEAESEICIVYLYEDAVSGAYPAEKNACSIQIDDFGGPGGESAKINFTINLNGDPTEGTFNPATATFNAGSVTTYLQTFVVDSGTDPVAGARIVINDATLITNANGMANIQLANGSYPYVISKTGFVTKNDTLVVSSAASIEEVTLTAS